MVKKSEKRIFGVGKMITDKQINAALARLLVRLDKLETEVGLTIFTLQELSDEIYQSRILQPRLKHG